MPSIQSKTASVYILYDKTTKKILYIGSTTLPLNMRLSQHVRMSRRVCMQHRSIYKWILEHGEDSINIRAVETNVPLELQYIMEQMHIELSSDIDLLNEKQAHCAGYNHEEYLDARHHKHDSKETKKHYDKCEAKRMAAWRENYYANETVAEKKIRLALAEARRVRPEYVPIAERNEDDLAEHKAKLLREKEARKRDPELMRKYKEENAKWNEKRDTKYTALKKTNPDELKRIYKMSNDRRREKRESMTDNEKMIAKLLKHEKYMEQKNKPISAEKLEEKIQKNRDRANKYYHRMKPEKYQAMLDKKKVHDANKRAEWKQMEATLNGERTDAHQTYCDAQKEQYAKRKIAMADRMANADEDELERIEQEKKAANDARTATRHANMTRERMDRDNANRRALEARKDTAAKEEYNKGRSAKRSDKLAVAEQESWGQLDEETQCKLIDEYYDIWREKVVIAKSKKITYKQWWTATNNYDVASDRCADYDTLVKLAHIANTYANEDDAVKSEIDNLDALLVEKRNNMKAMGKKFTRANHPVDCEQTID